MRDRASALMRDRASALMRDRASAMISVQRVRPEDWPAWRAIRVEALADTPIGFLERLADAERKTDEQWRERTTLAASGDEHGLWLAFVGDRAVGVAGGRQELEMARPLRRT